MKHRVMGHGLAIAPEKDLALFRTMAQRGRQLTGSDLVGRWIFADAEPEAAEFACTFEPKPTPDYYETFRAAGWQPVISQAGLQVFKGRAGAPPIHSDASLAREATANMARRYTRYTAVAAAVFLAVMVLITSVELHMVVSLLLVLASLFPLVYTAIPLIGLMRQLRRAEGAPAPAE